MNFQLLIDLHKDNERQGPGSSEMTLRALQLSGLLDTKEPLRILDLGCGTGASTAVLAKNLQGTIVAVDIFPDFLSKVSCGQTSPSVHVETLVCSMDDLPFEPNSFDVIWAEGSLYNMGFQKAVRYLKDFLKPEGVLAASEIIWTSEVRPAEITDFWQTEYPEIALPSQKIQILEQQGFRLEGYFPLPSSCWIDEYYHPLSQKLEPFLSKHQSAEANEIVIEHQQEIALYHRFQSDYTYGFFVARKLDLFTESYRQLS